MKFSFRLGLAGVIAAGMLASSGVALAKSPRLPSFFHHGTFPRVWEAIDKLRDAVNNLQDQIDALVLTPGPQGPAGPQGPQGPQGPKGDSGNGSSLPVVCPDCSLTNYNDDDFGDRWKGKDLSHAYLPGAYMTSMDLEGTNLSYANLQGAKMPLVNLTNANLSHANLSCRQGICVAGGGNDIPTITNWKIITIQGTDLSYANLRGVIMPHASGTPSSTVGTIWTDVVCPDESLANDNGGTCDGHFLP